MGPNGGGGGETGFRRMQFCLHNLFLLNKHVDWICILTGIVCGLMKKEKERHIEKVLLCHWLSATGCACLSFQ